MADEREAASMDAFLSEVQPRAYRMSVYALRDGDRARDVVQDAMLRLHQHYAARPAAEWPALFFRILHNRIQDAHREGKRTRTLESAWRLLRGSGTTTVADAADIAPPDERPEEAAEAGEIRHALDTALAELPWTQRQAFLLREWQGLTVAEAAQAMECSGVAVRQHHYRALRALRKLLAEVWSHV